MNPLPIDPPVQPTAPLGLTGVVSVQSDFPPPKRASSCQTRRNPEHGSLRNAAHAPRCRAAPQISDWRRTTTYGSTPSKNDDEAPETYLAQVGRHTCAIALCDRDAQRAGHSPVEVPAPGRARASRGVHLIATDTAFCIFDFVRLLNEARFASVPRTYCETMCKS